MTNVISAMAKSTKPTDKDEAEAPKRRTSSGDETRARIVEAALETLKSEGIVGTSARAIARQGDFNQALIFYHFGSVDDLVVAAVSEMSRRRMGNHKPKLESAGSLTELIAIGREIHNDDLVADNMAVLTQAFAGARAKSEIGAKLYTELQPWTDLVTDAVRRVLDENAFAKAINAEHIAQVISALFLGIELLEDLDPERGSAEGLFDTLEGLARILELLLQSPTVAETVEGAS